MPTYPWSAWKIRQPGAAIAAATTAVLSRWGHLEGPTLTGSRAATLEAVLATAIGAGRALVAVWWRSRVE